MMNPRQFNAVIPPYKYQPHQLPNKQFINPVINNNRSNFQQQNKNIITPDNLTENLSQLNIQDVEELASLIFDIVEKDYPK